MDTRDIPIPMDLASLCKFGKDQFQGLERPELLDKIVEGHKRYFETIEPDMMKLMNEGFMGYPLVMNNNLETAEDLLPSRASAGSSVDHGAGKVCALPGRPVW